MTKTRLKIIELIEPYMDKTLCEGCYVICNDEIAGIETENGTNFDDIFVFGKLISDETYNTLGYVDKLKVCTDYMKNEYDLSLSNFNNEKEFNEDIPEVNKIIGHYDITAVLKYIESHFYTGGKLGPNIITVEKDLIEIHEVAELCKCDIPMVCKIIGKIPNKPLHLYTEIEDKNLLKLLQNLGQK